MNELSYITQIAETKKQAVDFAAGIKQQILSGDIEPLIAAKQLKVLEEIVKELRSDEEIQELILENAVNEGKEFKKHGAKFQVRATFTSYDFKVCNDTDWEQLEAQEKSFKKLRKEREKFLKAIPEFKQIADPETGELISAPAKRQKMGVAISIK